jgi:RNA polymerase sigma-70 factor (ECF subfamily)
MGDQPAVPTRIVLPAALTRDVPDVDWLAAVRLGDEAAFANLFRDTQPRLLRYAASLVGQDAEDITAEAWLQIARDLRGFDGSLDDFRGWACRIVRNRALDLVRARARRPIEVGDLTMLMDKPGDIDTERTAVDHLSTAAAIALIASLPQDQAEAVMLRTVVGLDTNTAAEVLGKRPGAVRVAAHRGLRNLARRLEQGHE